MLDEQAKGERREQARLERRKELGLPIAAEDEPTRGHLRPGTLELLTDAKAAREARKAEAEATPASVAEVQTLKEKVGNALWNAVGGRKPQL